MLCFQDLRDIGITTRGHRKRLLYAIEKIPHIEMEQNVPVRILFVYYYNILLIVLMLYSNHNFSH